jgi:hypothetical protein
VIPLHALASTVPYVIFGLMRHLRTSGLPAILLALLMAVGVLLPEVSHSFAHGQGGGHAEHELLSQVQAGSGVAATVSRGHAADDHPHFELAATLPGKPLLAYAVAAQTVFRLVLDGNAGLQVPAATARTLAPPQSNHGPPPPTRAPPLV